MSRNRFVQPETTKIYLSDDEWFVIKNYLTAGEQKQLEATGVKRVLGLPATIDWEEYHIGRIAIWITEWNLRDADQREVPFSIDAIRALDTETFDEIQDKVTGHIEAMHASKKATTLTSRS